MEDWTGHAREDAARRVEEGSAPEAARDAAWRALGSPNVLADTAARELARGSWLGRHLWLGGLALPVLVWIVMAAAALVAPPPMIGLLIHHDPLRADPAILFAALVYWQHAFNWIPWLLSMAWLARIAVRMPGGWKLFWVTAVVLALCSTSIQMTVIPPVISHGHASQGIYLFPTGVLGVILNALGKALGYGPVVAIAKNPVLWQAALAGAWIQTAITLIGATTFYRTATSTRTAVSAAPAG